MSLAEDIDHFCGYFDCQVSTIGKLTISAAAGAADSGSGNEFRYRKVLYVTAIDTLAGFRFHRSDYPQLHRQNRERFTRFVKEHCSWAEGDLVSLPFLKDQLVALKLESRSLGSHVNALLAPFSTEDGGSLSASKIDRSATELLARATTEKEEEAIRDYQHFSLLYRYRNSLVHESREPGNAMEVFGPTTQPYYHGYIGDPKWYLAYPIALFESLLQRSVVSFKEYLIENSINPYSLIEDKARW